MKKTLTISVVTLALGLVLGGTAVYADEPMPISDTPEQPVNCVGNPDQNCAGGPVVDETGGEISEPSDEPTTDCIGFEGEGPVTDCATPVDPDAGKPEDKCEEGTKCDEAVGDTEDDEEGEPQQWPMYVSLGALGAAVVVFIILNLFGGKKK